MTLGADSFKWLLFGDDDTVFAIDNVLKMLEHLDPSVPYFITDHLWYPVGAGTGLARTALFNWLVICQAC